MDEYKDKSEKDKPIKKSSKNLEEQDWERVVQYETREISKLHNP